MKRASKHRKGGRARGFSVVELLVTLGIFLIGTVIAVPLIQNASTSFQMKGAVNSVTGAIQATRYKAIANGYPYRIAIDSATSTYRTWFNTCLAPAAACWVLDTKLQLPTPPPAPPAVPSLPLSGSSVAVTINQDTSLDFHPGGSVQASTGAMNFTLTYKSASESITVSNYGNITVIP